ncbi:hypothetical protein [Bradyrhizobium sp. UFLA05-112]
MSDRNGTDLVSGVAAENYRRCRPNAATLKTLDRTTGGVPL